MNWTTEKPAAPGWWWYRETSTSPPHPVRIFDTGGPQLYAWPVDDRAASFVTKDLRNCAGEWAGPLEPPA